MRTDTHYGPRSKTKLGHKFDPQRKQATMFERRNKAKMRRKMANKSKRINRQK